MFHFSEAFDVHLTDHRTLFLSWRNNPNPQIGRVPNNQTSVELLLFVYQLSLIMLKLMQSWTISRCLVLLIFVLFTCFIILYGLIYAAIKVFAALSPSFGRQEIINPRYHWTNMQTGKETGTGPEYTNIHSVIYSSDGRFLNATMWHILNIIA